ncbi:hypothetical protein ACIRPT_38605 [Streptomyces sp. NPDC101227]|uniref:hypothetical protein n=1 Tax=Streptomyces sp. NPDC101227 TaxID=3366136 RepID=UPI00380B3799
MEDAAMGRWEGIRDLLSDTGRDWDRRIFRFQALAVAGAQLRFADTWSRAEPESADAITLLAHVEAVRSMIVSHAEGQVLREAAWRTCHAAAAAYPEDPSPWVVLLSLLRFHAPDWGALKEIWGEVSARDPYNREAHHEVLTYLFQRNHGRAGEMFQWAQDRAETAPRGLPIAVLPLVALAESHRQRLEIDSSAYGLTIHPWIDCPYIDRVLEGWWHYRAPHPHAQFAEDANYLAHALSLANRHKEAWEVFEAIGPYACDRPWSYCGDAQALFLRHRRWAQNAITSR